MAQTKRWTVWLLRKAEGNRKPSKVPVANPTDDSTWNFFHAARAQLADEKIAGLGFEMYGKPGVVGVDLDNCVDELGNRTPIAAEFLLHLEAAGGKFHVEISPSGKGYRIFAGETPLPFHDYTNKETGVEVYTGESGRFLAFTGQQVPGFGEGPFDPLPQAAVEFLGKHAAKWKDGAARENAVKAEEPKPDVPDLKRREDWKKLHKIKLSKEHMEFLETGALGRKYASASEQLFAIEQGLLKHLKPAQAYQILISAEGTWGVALEHREGSEEKAKAFIWDDVIRAAASKEKHEKERVLESTGWKECEIIVEMTEEGARAKVLTLNIINAFQKHSEWRDRLQYNTFDGRVTIDKKEITIRQLSELSAWLVQYLKWSFEPRREIFEEGLTEAAKARPWNPVADELHGLVWDGKNRLKKFTEAIIENPEPIDYEIMRKWLISFVARGMVPGCKVDTMLCLRGPEGAFKTTFTEIMAGTMDRTTKMSSFGTDKDTAMQRGGMRIIEIGEGVGVRRSDRFELKDDLSKPYDHFRPPWGRAMDRRLRGFVYILTVNPPQFLRSDQDGLRRFWPVDVAARIDIEWLSEWRDQILAQAVELYTAGLERKQKELWWWDLGPTYPAALRDRQGSAVQEDPMDNAIETIVQSEDMKKKGHTNLDEIVRMVGAITGTTLNNTQVARLIDLLGKHGLTSTQKRVGGIKRRVWLHASWEGTGDGTVVDISVKRGEG